MVLDDRLDEHLLAQQFQLRAHVGGLREPSAVGFLRDHFLRDQVVENRLARLVIVGLTLRGALLDDEVQTRLGNGLAVDRHRLGGGSLCCGLGRDGDRKAQGQRG